MELHAAYNQETLRTPRELQSNFDVVLSYPAAKTRDRINASHIPVVSRLFGCERRVDAEFKGGREREREGAKEVN